MTDDEKNRKAAEERARTEWLRKQEEIERRQKEAEAEKRRRLEELKKAQEGGGSDSDTR